MTDASGIDKLTPKQQAFVEAFLECGSAADAYRRAYSCANMGDATIRREATRLLAHPAINHTITTLRAQAADQAALSRSWVLERLMRNAEVALGERTIKLRVPRKDKETGRTEVSEIEVSAHDGHVAARSLELLGKTDEVRLFVERVEATGKDGAPLLERPPTRDVARAILGILQDAKMEGAATEPPDDDPVDDEEIDDQDPEIIDEASVAVALATRVTPVNEARAVEPVPEPPRPRPMTLQPGERELIGPHGAYVVFDPEFSKFAAYGPSGDLHGYRRDLEAARQLASNIKPPPPPRREHENG